MGECWQGSLIPLTLREDTSGWVLTGFSYTSDSEGGHQWVSADRVLLYLSLWGRTPVGECWQGSLIPLTLREDTSGWVLTGFSYTSHSEGWHQWVSADRVLLYLWLWGTTPVGECWQGSLIPLTLRDDTSGWVLTGFSYTSDSEGGHQWVSADRVLLYLSLWGRTPVGECWQGSLIPLTLREDTSGWVLTGFSYTSDSEGGHQWVSADRVLLYLWLWGRTHQWVSADRVLLYLWLWGRTPVGQCWQGSLIPLTLREDTSGWVLTGFSYTSDSEGGHQWVSADRVLLYLWLWGRTPVGERWLGSLVPLTLREETPVGECWQGSLIPLTLREDTSGWVLTGFSYTSDSEGGHQWVSADRVLLYLWLWGRTHQWVSADRVLLYLWLWGRTSVGECWQGSLIPLTLREDTPVGECWQGSLIPLTLREDTPVGECWQGSLIPLTLREDTPVGECWQGSLIPLTLREDTPVGECWQGSLIPLTLREDTSGWVLTGFSYTSDSKGGHTSGWVLTGFSYTSDSEGGHQWVSADSVLLYLWLWGTTPVGECWQGSLIPLTLREDTSGWVLTGFSYTSDSEVGHTSGWVLTGFSYTSDSEGGHQWVSADRVLLYLWLWGRTPVSECWQGSLIPLTLREDTSGWVLTGFSYTSDSEGGHQWVSADRVLLYLSLWGRTPVGECWQGSLIPLTLREDTSGWVLTGFSYTSDSEGRHQWVSADRVLLYLWLWGRTHQWVSADRVLLYLWLWGRTPVGECWQGSLIPLTLRDDTSGWVLTGFSYTSDSEGGHQWVSADRVLLYLWLWGRTPVGQCWQGSLIPLTLREDTSGWVLTGFSYTSHSEGGHQWVSADRVLLYLWLWGRTPVGECWQGSLIPLTLREDTSGWALAGFSCTSDSEGGDTSGWVLTGFSYTSDSEGGHQWVSAGWVLLYLWLWGRTPVGECCQGFFSR